MVGVVGEAIAAIAIALGLQMQEQEEAAGALLDRCVAGCETLLIDDVCFVDYLLSKEREGTTTSKLHSTEPLIGPRTES